MGYHIMIFFYSEYNVWEKMVDIHINCIVYTYNLDPNQPLEI